MKFMKPLAVCLLVASVTTQAVFVPAAKAAETKRVETKRVETARSIIAKKVTLQLYHNLILLAATETIHDYDLRQIENAIKGKYDNEIESSIIGATAVLTIGGLSVLSGFSAEAWGMGDSNASSLLVVGSSVVTMGTTAMGNSIVGNMPDRSAESLLASDSKAVAAMEASEVAGKIFGLSLKQKHQLRADIIRELSLKPKTNVVKLLEARNAITKQEADVFEKVVIAQKLSDDRSQVSLSGKIDLMLETIPLMKFAIQSGETTQALKAKLRTALRDTRTILGQAQAAKID